MRDLAFALALAVSFSFVLAAPFDLQAQRLFERLESRLVHWQSARLHRDDQPADLGNAHVLVLGVGRTGSAAYDQLAQADDQILGLDADSYRVGALRRVGRTVRVADVEDAGFWCGLDTPAVRAVILARDSVEAKEYAARTLRLRGLDGTIVSHALYEDHLPRLHAVGASHTYLTMTQAGIGLADQALRAIGPGPETGKDQATTP